MSSTPPGGPAAVSHSGADSHLLHVDLGLRTQERRMLASVHRPRGATTPTRSEVEYSGQILGEDNENNFVDDAQTGDPVLRFVEPKPENRSFLSFISQRSNNQSPSNCSKNSSGLFCRICHEGDGLERLLSPCQCSGSVALVHQSCIEKWLSTKNNDTCELCRHKYTVAKQPRPFKDWLCTPSVQDDQRNLVGDMICFLLLTPLAAISTYLCATGAIFYYQEKKSEAMGLIALCVVLVLIYLVWVILTLKYHIQIWYTWRETHQEIHLLDVGRQPVQPASWRNISGCGKPTQGARNKQTSQNCSNRVLQVSDMDVTISTCHSTPQNKPCTSPAHQSVHARSPRYSALQINKSQQYSPRVDSGAAQCSPCIQAVDYNQNLLGSDLTTGLSTSFVREEPVDLDITDSSGYSYNNNNNNMAVDNNNLAVVDKNSLAKSTSESSMLMIAAEKCMSNQEKLPVDSSTPSSISSRASAMSSFGKQAQSYVDPRVASPFTSRNNGFRI